MTKRETMKYLKVNLWGKEIGRLVRDALTRRAYFTYNPDKNAEIPDIAPILSPRKSRYLHLPIYGDERPKYQGLPPFIADSLPDAWGNCLFDNRIRKNKIPRNKVTPLYKLMFIGTRGMGALEYEPCDDDLTRTRTVDIKSLYELSLKINYERDQIVLDSNETLTLHTLLSVGTSAGGRQMKAIIALNDGTGEIRSGQGIASEGFDYYIIKFGDGTMPIAEIETAYYKIAVEAGIEMEECRLFPVEGINHFLTKRFDRRKGKKIYTQTLAAINPEARSYEDMFATCREMGISESEIEQLFTRMVFNVMTNNSDDHDKNFSFILEEKGEWHLAPAYDVTFIFNLNGTGPNRERRMSIGGKTSAISKNDILEFAGLNGIKNAEAIMERVAGAVGKFGEFADDCGVSRPWSSIILKTLDDNLAAFGYKSKSEDSDLPFSDAFNRAISAFSVTVNSKRFYEVSATIDGRRRRRFVRPDSDLYDELEKRDIYNLAAAEKKRLVEILFPEE